MLFSSFFVFRTMHEVQNSSNSCALRHHQNPLHFTLRSVYQTTPRYNSDDYCSYCHNLNSMHTSLYDTDLWASSLPLDTIPRAGEAELVMGDGGTLDKMCIFESFLAQRTLERSCAGYGTWRSSAGTSTRIGTCLSCTTCRCACGISTSHAITIGSFTRGHCCWTNMATTRWSAAATGSWKKQNSWALNFIFNNKFKKKKLIFLYSSWDRKTCITPPGILFYTLISNSEIFGHLCHRFGSWG
jgi:hypothetical protein